MKIKFKRAERVLVRPASARRLASARRALQRKRDELPLLAELIRGTQPTPEELLRLRDAESVAFFQRLRSNAARNWIEVRNKLRGVSAAEREAFLAVWNRSWAPKSSEYFADMWFQWERGWRGEWKTISPALLLSKDLDLEPPASSQQRQMGLFERPARPLGSERGGRGSGE